MTRQLVNDVINKLCPVHGVAVPEIIESGRFFILESAGDVEQKVVGGREFEARCGRMLTQPVAVPVLAGIGYLCPCQNEHPAEVDPYEKKGQGGKRAVDGIIVCDTDMQADIQVLYLKPEKAGEERPRQGRNVFYPGVGEKKIDDIERQ